MTAAKVQLPRTVIVTARVLRWAGVLGILAIATLRMVTSFAPLVVFDLDPALYPDPLAGLGPAGSLWLDALLLLATACGFAGQALALRPVNATFVVLAMLPWPIIAMHGLHDAGDLWRGATWANAALAAVCLSHLAKRHAVLVVSISVLLAVIAPLLVCGAVQVTHEHANTVAEYERSRDTFLQARGWAPDSAAAKIYERRLRQPQPTGWFVTTNVYASFMALGMVVFAGAAVAARRGGSTKTVLAGLALLAVMCAAGLAMTGSKGAFGAAGLGLAVLIAPILFKRVRKLVTRPPKLMALSIGLVVVVLAAVVVRGAALPESIGGEKSLLFRWHYMVSSARIIAEHPLAGVGPDGYQEAYVAHRVPRNPEEVSSAHSIFLDWLCALGITGASWIAMCFIFLRRGGATLKEDKAWDAREPVQRGRIVLFASAAVALGAIIPAMYFELQVLDELTRMSRVGGLLGFIIVAALIARLVQDRIPRMLRWSLVAGALTLIVHAQIEITLVQSGAVLWAWCLLAVMGPIHGSGRAGFGMAMAVVAIFVALALSLVGAGPATWQQSLMNQAAASLYPPRDGAAAQAAQRSAAADMLEEAYKRWPINWRPLRAAVHQRMAAAALAPPDERGAAVRDATRVADQFAAEHPTTTALVLRANVTAEVARLTGDEGARDAAIRDAREVSVRDPHSIMSWKRLGDLLWERGARRDAKDAYARALEADANFELDELKRLPAREREALRERMADSD